MDFRRLRYFVETARRRSMTKAAAALHIVQPALTAQIKLLEEELGTTLLHRTPRGVSLTEDGEIVFREAVAILRSVQDLQSRFQQQTQASRPVRVGIPNGITRAFVADLITRAQEHWQLKLEIIEGMSGHLLEWLKGGRLDVSVLFAIQPLRQLDSRPLVTDSIDLVGPPGALDDTPTIETSRLSEFPLILPSSRHGLHRVIEQQARRAKVTLNQQATLDSIVEIKHLVSRGAGYTLLAPMAYTVELEQGLLSAARLIRPSFQRELVTAVRRSTDPASEIALVRDLIHDVCLPIPPGAAASAN